MKRLIIAEKPSVARDIARVVGSTTRRDGYIEGPQYDVTWCVGHLVELVMPDAYGWKQWTWANMPMLPDVYQTQPTERTEDQYVIVSTLLCKSNEYKSVINACDAGREGEHIFRMVYAQAGSSLPVERLWIASLTDDAIAQGMNKLQAGALYDGLADAARARSEADWTVGMNATRALTLAVRQKNPNVKTPMMSVGRVQTPTLALLVRRHVAISTFKPVHYYECHASFKKDGEVFVGKLVDKDREVVRFDKKVVAEEQVKNLLGHPAQIQTVERKQGKRTPPQFFDLTSLQRKANTDLGFSAKHTLDVAQALYERHKVLSYPRTDSKYITEDMAETLPDRLMALGASFEQASTLSVDVNALPKRLVDASKVTDHHAILVTDQTPTDALNDDEAALYEMVARRCMAAVAPDAKTATTVVLVSVGEGQFFTRGTQVIEQGWLAFEPTKDKKATDRIPSVIEEGQFWEVGSLGRVDRKTKPPSRLGDAGLLLAMETAGKSLEDEELKDTLKGSGLGTPATRASTIETLIGRKYIEREGKFLVPTELGLQVIDALRDFDALTSAQLTAQWEQALERVASGAVTRDVFIDGICGYTTAVVKHFKNKGVSIVVDGETDDRPQPIGTCPACQSDVMLYKKNAQCSRCQFNIWREVAGKTLSKGAIIALLTKKCTPVIGGFYSKKHDKKFDAALVLTEKDKGWVLNFEVGKKTKAIGVCPACQADVLLYPKNAKCSKCQFQIWREMAQKTLTEKNILDLLVKGRTAKIKGFVSKKKEKTFDARVALIQEGSAWRTQFDFGGK